MNDVFRIMRTVARGFPGAPPRQDQTSLDFGELTKDYAGLTVRELISENVAMPASMFPKCLWCKYPVVNATCSNCGGHA